MNTQTKTESKVRKELISGFLLEKTAKIMKLHFSRTLAQHPDIDITTDQWIILDILCQKGPVTQQDLAELSLKDAPTVTRILDILENKQLLTRQAHPTDRRKFQIALMEKGREMYDRVLPVAKSFRADCYENITPEELGTFLTVLQKIHNHIHPQL